MDKKSKLAATSVSNHPFDHEHAFLHNQSKELEMERDILKKVLDIFSRQK